MKKSQSFNPREIGLHLTNAMTFASRPTSLSSEITEKRMPRLREYMEAVAEPLFEHVDDDLLCPEELVFVFAAAAVYTHQRLVLKTDKLPLVK